MRDLPPEERLLRLIKGTHKKDEPSEEKPQKPETSNQKPDIEPQKKEEPKPKRVAVPISIGVKEKKLDPFKITIFLLTTLCVMGILYFTYELFGRKQQQPIIDIEKLITPEVKPTEEKTKEKQEPAAENEKETAEAEETPPEIRELFGAPVTRETPALIEKSPPISELAKDLVLVGVISGDNPQAVIQDKRTQQTHYASEGERVLEFIVKKIEKAMVVLEHNGETIKLSL